MEIKLFVRNNVNGDFDCHSLSHDRSIHLPPKPRSSKPTTGDCRTISLCTNPGTTWETWLTSCCKICCQFGGTAPGAKPGGRARFTFTLICGFGGTWRLRR